MARVVVVDDHPLVRGSLVKLLQVEGGYDVVGDAASLRDARLLTERLQPDVIVLDVTLGDGSGLDAVGDFRSLAPDVRVVLFTMHADAEHVLGAASVGVDAFVTKGAAPDELLAAIEKVLAGDRYVSPEVAHHLLARETRTDHGGLTARELEVLRALAGGARPGDIAAQLHIATKTVKNHLTSIYGKLGVETGAQAVAEAYRRGMAAARGARD